MAEEGAVNEAYQGDNQIRTNKIFGNIGVVVPSVDDVCDRLTKLNINYVKIDNFSGLTNEKEEENKSTHRTTTLGVRVRCPWGNTLYVYGLKEEKHSLQSLIQGSGWTKMNHLVFKNSIGIRGMMPGIRFLEFCVDDGTSENICAFYKKFLDCKVDVRTTKHCKKDIVCGIVMVGPNIHLVFSETNEHERYDCV